MYGKKEFKAIMLVLIMIISIQIGTISEWDFSSKDLPEEGPVFYANNADVSIISLGDDSACAIGTNQKMKCWGDGTFGKTGHGNTEDYGDEELEMGRYLYFTDVGENITFLDIAIGSTFSCALTNDSAIRCWGENDKLGSSSGISGSGAIGDGYREMGANIDTVNIGTWNGTSVEAGSSHACAIVNNGTNDSLICWGDNSVGQLGLGHTNTIGDDSEDLIEGQLPHVDLPDRGSIANIALGNDHTCILWDDGQIGCWGDNSQGQLGIGNTDTIGDESNEMGTNLILVDLPSSRTATAITAGNDFTCAIFDDTSASCWGDGENGRLGTGSIGDQGDESDEIGDNLNILSLGTGLGVSSFDAGESHICAILTNNQLKCWGYNGFGQLGYGDGYDRGDDDGEMGSELDPVSLGSGLYPTSIQAGNAFTCALLNNAQLKCWGTGADGRTGLGLTGAMGEQVNEMGDYLAYVELFMPLPTFSVACDTQAEGTNAEKIALDSTSSGVGNKISTTLTSENCASIAYVDDDSDIVKFGIFDKNKWTLEKVVEWESEIYDTSIFLDSNDYPHLFFMQNSGPVYATKIASTWTTIELNSDWQGSSLTAEIDALGNFYLFSLTETELIIITCLDSSDCTNSGSWSEVGSIAISSGGGYGLDSDISHDDEIWIANIYDHTYVLVSTCSNLCYSSMSNWNSESISNFGDASNSNASLAIDIAVDKSIHVVHNNMTNGLQYSYCETSCISASSWSTEEILSEYSTGVVDLSTGPDTTVVILAGTSDGEYTLHKKNNQWYFDEVKNIGDSGWVGIEITDLGQMWGFAHYPGDPNPFYLLRQKGMTTPGLNLDVDDDGWTRMDEENCGTDFKDGTSYPSDADQDGICDVDDGTDTGELSLGESDALSLGENFGCSLLSNNSVACWGDNSVGQLGNISVGSSSDYAVMVDLPEGFKASTIDAGARHACSLGLDFTIVCWGNNSAGELGRGIFSEYETPGYVTLPNNVLIRDLAVGTSHNCAKSLVGDLYCWGESEDNRLGKIINTNTTMEIEEDFDELYTLGWYEPSSYSSYWSTTSLQGNNILYRGYYSWWNTVSFTTSDGEFNLKPGSKIQFDFDGTNFGDTGGSGAEYLKVYSGDVLIGTLYDNSTTNWEDSYWGTPNNLDTKITMTVPDSFSDETGNLRFESYCYRCQLRIDNLSTVNYGYGHVDDQNIPAKLTGEFDGVTEITLGERHSCVLMHENIDGNDYTYCWGYNGGIFSNVLGGRFYSGMNTWVPILVDLSNHPDSLISSIWYDNDVDSINAGSDTTCAIMSNLESICWGKSSQTEYIDPASNIIISEGKYPALMYAQNKWSVAYYDSVNGDLGYAVYDGNVWNTSSVYSGSNDIGNGVSVGLDNNDRPSLVAYDYTNDSVVHFQKRTDSIESDAVTTNNNYFPTTVVDTDGIKHVVYIHQGSKDLRYTYFNGTEWSAPTTIASGSNNVWQGWGVKDLEIDSIGELHLSYYTWDAGPSNDILHLNYAKYNGSAWNITEIKQHSNGGALNTWVSKLQTSLELDSNNHPHIAYYNGHNSTIGYSHYDGTSWVTTTVATDSYGNGGYASIALDSNDYPRIAYYNYTNNSLELATWGGSNWNFEVVFSGGGKYPSLEIDTNDYNRIVYYGNTANAVRYGISTDDDWTMEEVNAFGIQTDVSYPLKFGIDNNNNPRISLIDFVGQDNVVLIYNNGGEWYKFDVEDYSGKSSNFLDTFIDSEGTAHITYVDTGNTRLVRYSTIYTGTVYGKYYLADTGDVSASEPDTSFFYDASNNLNAIFMDNNESGLKHVVSHQLGDVDRTTPGYRGYYPSLEVDSTGRLHAAYWDTSTSDLVYSTKIDGGAWQTQIIDQEGSVGKYSSIALDSDDNPHISYIDETNQELKYAKFNGTGWEISEIYNDWMDLTYGYPKETSIAIDSLDRPHIAYNVMAYNTSWSGWNYFVRHTFNNESGWETSDVKDQNRNHNYGNTGRDVSLAINSTGEIFIIYHDDWDDSLYVANMTIQNLPTDDWEIEKISTSAGGLERSAALTIDTNDSLHVAYYDRSGADLHYAYCSSMCDTNANWEITSDVDTSSNSIGRRVDIIVDFDNNPHIAHYDASQDDLEYAYCEDTCSSSSSWYKRTMESGDNVGYMPSLVQDKKENIHFIYANLTALKVEITTLYSGNNTIYNISSNGNYHYGLGSTVDDDYNDGVQVPQVHLSYYNGTDSTGKLQYSYFNDVGVWETTVIDDSSTKTGLYSDIELDGAGYPHISYYDHTNSEIKYAKYDGSAWIISVVASVGSSSSHTSIELDNLDRAIIAYRDSSTGNLEMASWDGSDWNIATQDDAGTGVNDNSGVELIFHSDGRNYLAFYDGENDNLEFVEAGYYSPVLMGNSEYDRRGTLLDGGSNPVSTIDIGDTHGCAIIANVIKCWGLGSSGQLGNNVFGISSLSPVNVTTLAGFIPIEVAVSIKEPGSSGTGFSCSLYRNETTDARSIMCWGNSENGQIGSGSLLDNLGEPSTSKMVKTDELTVLGIVDNSEYYSTSPNDVMKIFTNKYLTNGHNCAISYVGHVKCWGYNGYGQLGIGNTTTIGDGPNEMGENQKFVPLGTNRTAKDMALGYYHSCAILDNDSVKCWGYNGYGQLGLGNATTIGDNVYEMWGDRYTTVDLGANVTATQITAGAHHTCILTNLGEVKCWGNNQYGQLGIGSTNWIGDGPNEMGDNLESVDLGDGRSAIEISAGQYNTCAILDSGLVKCWGYNNQGQLGIGNTNQIGDVVNEMGNNLKIADLGDNITALSIETSPSSVCAILNTRDIKCWGYNGNGQLGLQNTTNQGRYQNQMGDNLAVVSFEDQMSVFKLSGGGLHNCAILENEELKCWGNNQYGQLGIGNTNQIGDGAYEMGNYLATTRLPTPYIKFISSGHSHTCAIIFDNSIRCWGYNYGGQLGIGNNEQIGDSSSEMGIFMETTDINLVPTDTDGDGWIDVWDNDDDNDGYIDVNDDLPFDVRDHIDSDGDGLGDNVDTDDDDDSVKTIEQDTILTWSDIEEEACGYMPMSSLSTPADYDGDGICDKLDNDVDGNGWENTYQRMCHDAGSSDSWEQSEFFDNYYADGPYYAGYDFLINEYGIQLFATYYQNYLYSNMLRHDGTIVDGGTDVYGSNSYYYMDVEQQNGITYLLNQAALYRGANRNTSEYQSYSNFFSSTYSFDGSDGGELAISQDGQIALAYNGQDSSTSSSEITGSYLPNTGIQSSTAGTNFAFDAPFWARGGQIVFGSDYRLHLLQLYGDARDSGLPIGFYHSYADLNLTMDMDSIVEWSEPSLVLNRNQSATGYEYTGVSDAGNYRADLHISDDGTIYAAMYNNTDLVVATYDGTSWNNQVLAESTGINEGVVIASNSTYVPHIAWINHSSDTLMISVLEGTEWTTTEVWDPSAGWDYNYRDSKLTLEFNEFDDIFLMSTKYGTNSAIMHHKSSLYAPEYNYNPTDYDLDGICDNLQYAVIDYDREDIEIQVGEMISFTPSFRGQEVIEIWAPSLPEGLSINNTTGVISGTPIFTNLIGTSYTIYSNSTNTSYPITLTISITSKPSTFAMYGDYYGYTGGSPISEMQNAYDSEGNLYYYGACANIGQWGQDTDWSGSCNGYYDLVIAKRNSNSTWAWVKLLDCSNICSGGSMVLDDAGNSYVIGHKNGIIDLYDADWDLTPARHSAFVMSLDSSGEIRWVEEIYSSQSGVTWQLGLENSETVSGYGMSQISVNNSTGELTFSGSLKFNGNAHDLTFGDLTYTSDVVDSYGPYRPFVARMNESGNFSWVQMAISTGDSWIQDMVVQENGTVSLLWKSSGEISLGEYTIGQTEGCYSSVGSCSRSILGSINSTGNWTGGVPITVYSGSSTLYNEDVYLMMEQISNEDLIISIWARSDVSEIRISNTSLWFNTTCQHDNLVLIKLDKDDFTNKADREICTPDNSMYYANRYSRMKVDSQDRLWLFLGQQYYSTSNYYSIFRMDNNFNTDFKENLTYNNNPSNAFLFSWKSVCFDSNDNLLASAYSSTSSLYYDGAYMSYTGSYYYRVMFFMDEIKHTIDGQMPVSGEEIDYRIMGLGAISQYDYNFIDSFSISPDLPEGLIFSTTTGSITGTAINNASQTNYTIWANDTGSSIGNVVLNISFGIGNGKPTVTYDQTAFVFERGTPISPIVPTEINGSIISWQVVPELPNGLELGDSNGTIWGTPMSNMSYSMFTLQVSSDGATRNIVFSFIINEPLATIEYGNGTVTMGRDTVVNVYPTLGGGAVSSFGISPITLPLGLSFNTESGSITGTPRLTNSGVNYTVWANNSGGSVSTTFTIIITGNGISLTFPTPSLQLVNGSAMQPFAGQTSGSAPESWEIVPELPNGLEFGENNGTIWGTPEDIMNGTMYRIWANTTAGESASAQLNISIELDTDGDGVPDITDNDDDNDGWLDIDEISCGNDPLNINDVPSDADNDGICDSIDDSNDSIIVISYFTSNLNVTVNQSFTPLVPATSGGAVTSWEVYPDLPSDIVLNPGNGVISGMATTTFNATLYTIWGNNSVYSDSFDITITSSLLDTDGDGIPDETDEDDDDDGWLDTEEIICLTDTLDDTDIPIDTDGDGLCDGQDNINDSQIYLSYGVEQVIYIVNQTTDALHPLVFAGDVVTWEIYPELPDDLIFHNTTGVISGMATSLFESLNITIWANNSQYSSQYVIEILSILLDTDEDGIPDEIDDDDDGDGWLDADEITCLTDTTDDTDYPTDSDEDSVCDGIDDVDDSPIYLTYSSLAQNLFVNEPMDLLVATVYGGDVREWEVYPELPEGLSLDKGTAYRSLNSVGTGTISGSPISEFDLSTFTIWANNSKHSDSVIITLRASVADIDDSEFDLIYLDDYANLTVDEDYLYLEPMIFGGNVTSWNIVPEMFGGITFNTTNGVISGMPNINFDLIIFEITASNSLYIDSYNVSITAQYLDTDSDGVPDYIDEDDDGDGWTDADEEICGTDSLEFYGFPRDIDSDNLCDSIDDIDDSPILFFYPNDKIVATVGKEISPIIPIIAPTGGDILNYSVTPDLPEGLEINNITGIISGMPLSEFNHLILEYSHTVKAENGQHEFRYTVDFDILPEVIDDTDSDEDGWRDAVELECGTSPFDSTSYPLDIDNDGKCAMIDDDDDGDGRADLIDDFANDSTAWLDTDGDGLPDEVTCQYAVNSAECALMDLIEDNDDDNDGWNDTREIDCSTDPKNSTHIPIDDDDNGICDRLEGMGIESVPKILWICCFPLVLLLLLLLWLLNPFGVKDEEIRGPEPPYTSSSPKIEGGSGEYDNPFILKTVKNVRAGGSVESRELIKITNITPRLEIDFINLSVDDDNGRFNMNNMKASSRGEIEFRLQFNDFNMSSENSKYVAFIRVGKASVYFKWEVQVVIPKDLTDEEVTASRAAAKSAAVAAEAERIAAEANAEAERAVAEAEREAAIAMETSAAAMAADGEFDDDFDDDFDDEEINSAEEEEAAKTAAILLANEEKEKVESEQPASKATKKEEEQKAELLRVKERASTIDFETLGMATSSELKNEVNEGADSLEVANASDFAESGYARISDSDGSSVIAWTGKNGDILTGVSGVTRRFAAASIVTAKDDLQVIKGIGPFLEEKLNALGITTYRQIANMDSKLEEEVNVAIEFFPGRVKRDQWVTQAKILLGEDLKLDEKIPNQIDESQSVESMVAAEEEAAAKAAAAKAAAEEEAAAKAAAEEEAAAKAAAVMARLKAAQEEAERIAKEEAERALAEMDEKERAAAAKAAAAEEKKRKLLARVAEKAENIDFATIGIAATSDIVSEITTESTSITLSDASAFPESGNAYIYDPSGNILLKWEGKEDNTLIGVSGITKKPPLGAIIIERDNLQDIKGVGPFIEEKLNALGIYTFKQIANMNLEIEEQVNVAIEFFPGRIRRDEWAKQAHDFITEDES